jgi:hypothetical protein
LAVFEQRRNHNRNEHNIPPPEAARQTYMRTNGMMKSLTKADSRI